MEGPVSSFARSVWTARNLYEAVVEAEVVTQRVLPSLCVFSVVGEAVHNKFVDIGEGKHSFGRMIQRHGGKSDVRIRGLLITVSLSGWPRHCDCPLSALLAHYEVGR